MRWHGWMVSPGVRRAYIAGSDSKAFAG
jgi:hypothetical protein